MRRGYDVPVPRRILLASPRGYCAGVERAVDTVEQALDLWGPPVYVRKQIVHNHHVVESLERRGARFVDSEDEVPEGALVLEDRDDGGGIGVPVGEIGEHIFGEAAVDLTGFECGADGTGIGKTLADEQPVAAREVIDRDDPHRTLLLFPKDERAD